MKWDQTKTPIFSTRIQQSTSGKQLRAAFFEYPLYQYDLSYEVLRDDSLHNELQTLMGFYLQRQGAFDSFLYVDPSDNTVIGQTIGAGDGGTKNFQLIRTYGGFTEPCLDVLTIPGTTFPSILQPIGGNLVTSWTNYPGILYNTFNSSANIINSAINTGGNAQCLNNFFPIIQGQLYQAIIDLNLKSGQAPEFICGLNNAHNAYLYYYPCVPGTNVFSYYGQSTWNYENVVFSNSASCNWSAIVTISSVIGNFQLPNIYLNGVLQTSGYTIANFNSGILSFTSAPGAGVIITADFSYYKRVCFIEYAPNKSPGGTQDAFNQFLYHLWELKSLSMITVR